MVYILPGNAYNYRLFSKEANCFGSIFPPHRKIGWLLKWRENFQPLVDSSKVIVMIRIGRLYVD